MSVQRRQVGPSSSRQWHQGTGGGSEARFYSRCICGCGQQRPIFKADQKPLTVSSPSPSLATSLA